MSAPPRLLDSARSSSLSRALRAAPGEPQPSELEQLSRELGRTLGLGLPLATASAIAKTSTVSKAGAVAASFKVGFGAGVLGGLALGLGLSSVVAYGVGRLDGSTSAELAKPRAVASEPAVRASDTRPPHTATPTQPLVAQAPLPAEAPPRMKSVTVPSTSASTDVASESEVALLRRAELALSRDPQQALTLANEHSRRWGTGALEQEREVIAIDALMRMGLRADATARAQRFNQRFPGSAHARRIEVLLGRQTPADTQNSRVSLP